MISVVDHFDVPADVMSVMKLVKKRMRGESRPTPIEHPALVDDVVHGTHDL
jgi:hypothetical protein